MNSLQTNYIPNVLRHMNTLNALKLIYAHVSNVESHMISEQNVVYFCPISTKYVKLKLNSCICRWLRWGCLALLSLPLPCLLCYPLLKGINLGMETCYQAATARGCRCPDNINNTTAVRDESQQQQQQNPNSSLSSPTDSHKRLLG